jgi:membrane protease YdiL (CAAX protease family)
MKIKPFTIAGLILAGFGVVLVQILQTTSPLANRLSEQSLIILSQIMIWLVGLALVAIVKWGEKHPLTSIGFKTISGREILFAILIGLALSIMVPILTVLVSQVIPASGGGDIQGITSSVPWWILLISILTAGVIEELIYRGYIIERLHTITNSYWVAIFVSVIAFVLPHIAYWNTAHVVGVVLPLGLVLSGLYVWKRNLIFNMIVHFMIDFPLVIMAFMSN